jgi:hypothetical protein
MLKNKNGNDMNISLSYFGDSYFEREQCKVFHKGSNQICDEK